MRLIILTGPAAPAFGNRPLWLRSVSIAGLFPGGLGDICVDIAGFYQRSFSGNFDDIPAFPQSLFPLTFGCVGWLPGSDLSPPVTFLGQIKKRIAPAKKAILWYPISTKIYNKNTSRNRKTGKVTVLQLTSLFMFDIMRLKRRILPCRIGCRRCFFGGEVLFLLYVILYQFQKRVSNAIISGLIPFFHIS